MAKEKVLTIVKGEEFKLSMKETIEEDDIFYEQYVSAASMLDDIVSSKQNTKDEQADWCKMENENNIIAFCGERGEGKSSTMMTFINVLSKYRKQGSASIFEEHKNIEPDMFSEPVVIDPSVFDKVHNILDVVVANLFKKFSKEYNRNPRRFEDYKREELLSKFQKVYKSVSLLNDPDKMLETEYDGEGSIENISKMGESIRLKEDMKALVKCYLESMSENNKILLVAIDDLDLCNNNVYKMAEQIRKYLIIPNVVIVMALKIEQLEMCVQEENLRNYSNVINSRNKGYEEEIRNMAERYIAKLIPKSRRIYLPNVRYINDARIEYREKNGQIICGETISNSINVSLLHLIYMKTGMKFLLNNENVNWLLPDNLRELVNMICLLGNMQEAKENDETYYENIKKFEAYYEKEWIPQNCEAENCKEIQSLMRVPYGQLHVETLYFLRKNAEKTDHKYAINDVRYQMEGDNCFFWVRYWLHIYETIIYGRNNKKLAYIFQSMYTIRMSELRRKKKFWELGDYIGGYIWGPEFNTMLPDANIDGKSYNRSRISLPAEKVYNTMAVCLGNNELLNRNIVSKIAPDDVNREKKILTWIMTGLLSNTYTTGNSNNLNFVNTIYTYMTVPIVHTNYVLNELHVCLENYMVSLCNLKYIYRKVNMELLGIEWDEFCKIADRLEKLNSTRIEAFRSIFTNVDLISPFWNQCYENRQSKESGEKDERIRTIVVVERFFRNIDNFLLNYFGYSTEGKLNTFIIESLNGERIEINISALYADLMQDSIDNIANKLSMEKQNHLSKILTKLYDPIYADTSKRKAASFLKTKTAENAKRNMDNLLHSIKQYYVKHPEKDINELDMTNYMGFYNAVLEYYVEDPKQNIPDELCETYRNIVAYYTNLIEE